MEYYHTRKAGIMQTRPFDIVLHVLVLHCSLDEHLFATNHLSYNACLSGRIPQTHRLFHVNTGLYTGFAHYSVGHLTMQRLCFLGGTHRNLYF